MVWVYWESITPFHNIGWIPTGKKTSAGGYHCVILDHISFYLHVDSSNNFLKWKWNETLSATNRHWVVTFTFQISLWCSGLPRLHKDSKSDHIPNHDGKSQADHEHHCQGAIDKPTATDSTERGQRLAWPKLCLSRCSPIERVVCSRQQNCCTPRNTDVGQQSSHGPGLTVFSLWYVVGLLMKPYSGLRNYPVEK